jgi:AraC-like DNA-binding protein
MDMLTYIPKSPAIRGYTSFIWELKGNRNRYETILPSGVMEIIFNLSKPISAVLPHGKNIDQAPDCFIQGIHTQILKVAYSDRQHLFGMRLKPHMVRSFLGVLPSELSNEAIDLTLIKPQFRILWHQLVEAHSFEDRVKLLEINLKPINNNVCRRSGMLGEWFLRSGHQMSGPIDLQIDSGTRVPFDSVNSLAQLVSFSTRHLNRKTQEIFGLTAEELIRYKKFLRAVELMHQEVYSLTEVSHLAGFFDQSHFIRVFKSFTDMTPKRYLQTKGKLPFHLFF